MIHINKNKVKQLISAKGMTVREFAITYKFHQPGLQSWLSGKYNPRPKALNKLASALNCAPSDITEPDTELTQNVMMSLLRSITTLTDRIDTLITTLNSK